MQIDIEKPILEEALATVSRAVNPRSPLPILSHIHMETQEGALRLHATDLDLGLRSKVPAQVALGGDGRVCVPAKLFGEIIGKFPGAPVTLTTEEGRIRINCGRSKLEVCTLPAEEFPEWPNSNGHPEISLPQETFKKLVHHTLRAAAANDESRAVMTGVRMEIDGDKLILVATDGRRLAYAQHVLPDSLNQQAAIIIPGKAINELARACTDKEQVVLMRLADNHLWAATMTLQTHCRLLEGHFPDYRRVIPQEFQRACRVGREALVAGLRRMLVVAVERQAPGLVVFDFQPERVELSANTPDVGLGVEEIPCILEGADLRIAFNGKYVLDALTALDCEEVVLDLQDDTRSAVVRAHGETDFLHVLMPVRLREAVVEEAEQVVMA